MNRLLMVSLTVLAISGMVSLSLADCPDGVRQTSDSERQAFLSMNQAIKLAIPPAPAGWSLRDPRAKMKDEAPSSVCNGGDLMAGWYGEYIWDEESRRAAAKGAERDARIRKASVWAPEEEKELREYEVQSRDVRWKAKKIAGTDPAEAARLNEGAKRIGDKINAIRKAHADRVAPAVQAIQQEGGASINAYVQVNIATGEEAALTDVQERLQISGVSSAFVNSKKELVLVFGQKLPSFKESGGIGTKPRILTAIVTGDRQPAEIIARLLASPKLGEVGKK